MMATTPLLHIKNLSVNFITDGQVNKALKNIDISVSRGELIAIVGESGSGKSVTSLSVLQLLASPPAVYTSGELLLTVDHHTTDLIQIPSVQLPAIRGNKIGMIFQEPMTSLNPVMTCGQQVMEAIRQHKPVSKADAIAKTIHLFERVKLPDPGLAFYKYPHQLSGGQKQRVMIAMAICCEPALLICDEPTTALDVTVQKNILQLIRELQQQNNMGVIFITHDLSVVAEIADRVAVMYKGAIVEQGTKQQIFITPQHPYTKALLACRPLLHPKNERLPVVSDFMDIGNDGEIIEKKILPANLTASAVRPSAVPPKQASTLVSVENLKVYYPAKKSFLGKVQSYAKAVDDISFAIYEGETLGLVGESGCGKTTLGRALLRLIAASGGSIYYKGFDLLNANQKTIRSLRKEMQIVFQDPYSSLNPRMTIGDAIAEPLLVHKLVNNSRQRKEKVISLLEKVNLGAEHYNRYPHEFSGGQRQRVVIARALALNPSFLICDESISALDVSVQAQVLNLINNLKKELGFTAVFISHDLSVVRYISDRIMVMHQGKIEETGPAEQVYNHPQSTYTQRLIASIPGKMADGILL